MDDKPAQIEGWAQFKQEHGIAPAAPVAAPVVASPYVWRDPSLIPPRKWLFGRHAVRTYVSLTAAAGGAGKTSNSVAEALALASGRNLLDDPVQQARTWYIGLEDPLEEYERRIAGAAIFHDIEAEVIEQGLFLDSGRNQDFVIAHETRQGVTFADPIVNSIIENIRAKQIALVIVDPFVASHAVSESDNSKLEKVTRKWAQIAHEANCAVELIHHIRKGNGSNEPSAEDARGASALVNAARSVRTLIPMTKEEAERARVEERRRYFRVHPAKANLFLPSEKAVWRQLASQSLDNGGAGPSDFVGVVRPWTWPDALEGVTVANLRAVQAEVAAGQWRKDQRSPDWVGNAVAKICNLDVSTEGDRHRVNSMLKTWFTNGMLVEAVRDDVHRKPKAFVEVGQWATD